MADRLIQGQVTRAEVEEHTFAIKRELAAIKQHDLDTTAELETAKDRIRKLSEIADTRPEPAAEDDLPLPSEIIRQKEEMINCLQDELIKVRLREAENEESIRNLEGKVSELEEVRSYWTIFQFLPRSKERKCICILCIQSYMLSKLQW